MSGGRARGLAYQGVDPSAAWRLQVMPGVSVTELGASNV